MTTALCILLLIVAVVILVIQQLELNDRHEFRERYPDLCDFLHFVGTCKDTEANRWAIIERLMREKAKPAAREPKYGSMLKMIEQIFNARFNKQKPCQNTEQKAAKRRR